MVEHIDFQAHEKKKTLEKLLEGRSIYIHVNTKSEGLDIPSRFSGEKSVTLQISYEFRTELNLSAKDVRQDLLFDGEYYTCVVPLAAVWGASGEDGESVFWEESAPEGLFQEGSSPETKAAKTDSEPSTEPAKDTPKGPPVLKRIK